MTAVRTVRRRSFCALAVAAPIALQLPRQALAQAAPPAYPSRPIKVVFPYPAGSALDVIGRLICDTAARSLGQPIVFENRAGSNGLIGLTQVARAEPDGYTIGLTTTSSMFNNFYRKKPPYEPLTDFVPVTAVVQMPAALIVPARLPVASAREFIEFARKNPGKLNYASTGPGSFNHLLMEQFKSGAGLDIVHIPYQGAALIVNELLAGRVDVTMLSVGTVMPQWRAGQVKVLATMTQVRAPSTPELPAITEDMPRLRIFESWMGFIAPRGTPDRAVARLGEALAAAAASPDIRKRIEDERFGVLGTTSAEFRALIRKDFDTVESAFKASGLQPE